MPSRLRDLALAALLPAVAALPSVAAPPTDAQRLDRLAERIDAARIEHHVPGVALAVVRGDEIVLARGFGLADIAANEPVTPETIFAIGSTTKAFTATVIAMLVDEGRMTWDDPLSRWLPEFRPVIDGPEDEAILLRDMLCHRTGFTRMSMLWVSGQVPCDEMLRVANGAEPWAPFRTQFLYNNVMYLAAGMAAAEAGEASWAELVRTRILEPLGMDDSTLSITEAATDPRLALGYSWNLEDEDWRHLPMRNLDRIAPAGAINSNVLDVAEWIRLQLGRGTYEGRTLVEQATLEETWEPQIAIGGGAHYGLGWMLREWEGRRVVEHGGNIDGFAAQIALLPESDLGYVLLTNTGFSPLQAGSMQIVFDALAGDWQVDDPGDADSGPSSEGLGEFEGVYIANYAQFDDERFTVSVTDDGRLALDIPSQRTFVLGPPKENGRRPFEDAPGIAADFERDDAGRVQLLRLYQGGLKFDVPREGYEHPIEIPLEQLEKYCGRYRFDAMNADVEVLVRHNHLAVDVPGQMLFELHPPVEDGRWRFRNSDVMEIAVSFTEAAFGQVESMTMHQAGQEFVLPRIAEVAGALPSLEEVFTLARLDERQAALEARAPLSLSGEARFAQSGIEGTAVTTLDADTRFRMDIELGAFGSMRTSVDGDHLYLDYSFAPFEKVAGRRLEAVRGDHPSAFLGDWRRLADEIRLHGRGEVDGRSVLLVKTRRGDLPESTLHVDADTGDILRIDSAIEIPELGNARLPIKTTLRDWRDMEGVRVPAEMVVESQQNGRLVVRVREVQPKVDLAPSFYTLRRADG